MKRIFVLLLALLAAAGFNGALAEESENLIINGDFSQVDSSGLPSDWSRDMWYTDTGVSNLFLADDGYSGSCAAVVNADANDARFAQTVAVEPNTVYRFSCMVRANDCGEGGYGASISIEDTFVYSNQVYDTAGEWQPLTLYGRTTGDQTSITVMLRVGGYGSLNEGSAYFDDVEMVKLEAAPGNAAVQSLATAQAKAPAAESADENAEPGRSTEAYLLMAAIYILFALAAVRKCRRLNSLQPFNARLLLVLGLVAALLVRLITGALVRGYYTDINCFSAWSDRIFKLGPGNFYATDYFCDYPPGYMLLLWPIGALRAIPGLGNTLGVLLLKFIPILCDLLGALLIWRFAEKRHMNSHMALLIAMLYAFNPAAIVDSAAWGQIDSVFTLLLALCAVEAAGERYIPALIAFAASMLIKPQALLFAPLGLFAIVVSLIRRPEKKKLLQALIGLIAALLLIYFNAFVFAGGEGKGLADPLSWLLSLYRDTMGGYEYVTINALNLYALLNLNWVPLASQPLWQVFSWCMFAVSYLYAGFLYLRAHDRRKLLLTGALLITLIFNFGPMIHERYIFPALLLLALAYVVERDRRILVSLIAMTAVTALNEVLVLQGGMTSANFGHLQASEQWLNASLSLINVLNALFLSYTALDICVLDHVTPLQVPRPERRVPALHRLGEKANYRLKLKKYEYLSMAAVTLVYALLAFTNLGATDAPQNYWTSSQSGEQVLVDLGETQTFRMLYYGNICNTTFTVELSNDGANWTDPCYAQYDQGEVFRWVYYVPMSKELTALRGDTIDPGDGSAYITYSTTEDLYPYQTARYLRLTAQSAGLKLTEIGFRSEAGELIPIASLSRSGELEGFATDPQALIDEQRTVPESPSYLNSTYFDEIYHARTAYEMLHGEYVYEWTHPPLGKVLMMLGIELFGMTPFGWRFMGTLIGVLMLPLMYLLAKQLTKSAKLSFIAMALMALDSMHFTQTRIATIDSFSVFWIMLMYLFMFRYAQMSWNREGLKKTLLPLSLCGVTMGIAWATKWIGIYGSAGLAIIFFWTLLHRIGEYAAARRHSSPKMCAIREHFWRNLWVTLGFCMIFFIIIPILIYYFSYYWQLQYDGVHSVLDMFKSSSLKRVFELQKSMFSYHAGLGGDTHFFRSPWYQWPVIHWPMWYYSGANYVAKDMVSSISCMGNPAVWWTGLAALLATAGLCAWRRRAPKSWVLVLIGFGSQFLPWVLVPRSTFIYHYFASVPFIILCTVLMLNEIRKRSPRAFRYVTIALLTLALILFVAFYPLESGLPVPRAYAKYLRWFSWYNY